MASEVTTFDVAQSSVEDKIEYEVIVSPPSLDEGVYETVIDDVVAFESVGAAGLLGVNFAS